MVCVDGEKVFIVLKWVQGQLQRMSSDNYLKFETYTLLMVQIFLNIFIDSLIFLQKNILCENFNIFTNYLIIVQATNTMGFIFYKQSMW
jgi:hypothetical protein